MEGQKARLPVSHPPGAGRQVAGWSAGSGCGMAQIKKPLDPLARAQGLLVRGVNPYERTSKSSQLILPWNMSVPMLVPAYTEACDALSCVDEPELSPM